jgi:hypothetical protein
MRLSHAVLASAIAVVSCLTQVPAADPPKKAYLIFPVRTKLQQEVFFEKSQRYYLLVHGDSLIDSDEKLDPALLNFDDLSNDIGRVLILQKGDTISAQLLFAKEPPRAADRLVNMAILGWARERGFDRHVPSTVIGDREWKTAVRLTGDARGLFAEKESEDPIGDEDVRVYPVRTALSRLQCYGSECVVVFPRPYGKDATGALDDKVKARAKGLVDSLKLKERKQVMFGIWMADDVNGKAVGHFTKTTARDLADALGFKDYSVLQKWTK